MTIILDFWGKTKGEVSIECFVVINVACQFQIIEKLRDSWGDKMSKFSQNGGVLQLARLMKSLKNNALDPIFMKHYL